MKTDTGTILATYTYGTSNQRLKTVDGSGTCTWYVWEGGKVIAEYNTVSGVNINWQKNYVFLGDRLLATESMTTVLQFHHPDRLGSRFVTNASDGSSAEEQETLPFGTAIGAGISGNNRRFTSYDRSVTTKLDYAVNRFYHAGLGRFTQVDPIGMGAASPGDPQSLNLYAYCQNDPINHVDPDGLDPTGGALTYVIISIIGAIFGAIRAGNSGSRARTAPIVKKVNYRSTAQISNRAVWTQAGIQAGVGAVSAFVNSSKGRDVKKIRRDFYRLYGKLFNDCIKRVFGADAVKVPKQTINNSASIDGSLNEPDLGNKFNYKDPVTGKSDISGYNQPNQGTNGTVYIAADLLNSKGRNALKAVYGTYAHEKGNILDAQINNPSGGTQGANGRPYEESYGDPNRRNSRSNDKDTDTGSAIERCIFGSLQYP